MNIKHISSKTSKNFEEVFNLALENLKKDSCEVIDIKYASSDMDFSAIIAYQRQY